MREIKFRAWFPKEHYSEPHMAYSPTDRTDEFGGRSSTWDLIGLYEAASDAESPIYMQYTGLKDKNGVEIYEGDIIAGKFNGGYIERVYWKGEPDVIAEVFWSFSGYQLNCKGDNDRRYATLSDFLDEQDYPKNGEMVMLNLSHTEVIGNVYENPELLK